MNLLTLLADFIRTWVINLIPQPLIVRKTHKGVRFVWGKNVKKIEPGFYFYWPFTTEIELYPVVRQTSRLPTQCLMDAEDHPVVVGAVLVYEIDDIIKALSEVMDIDETIEDISLATIKGFIVDKSLKGLSKRYMEIDKELTKSLRIKLKPYGVKVLNVYLSDCSGTKVIKHYGIQVIGAISEGANNGGVNI